MDNKELFLPLKRLLEKLSLDSNCLPFDLKNWQAFLIHLNGIFNDLEQERYLLERSMTLSSAEYLETNDQFSEAESIAHIGHWAYHSNQDRIFWSAETYAIFGIQNSPILPGYLEFLNFIHKNDRQKLMQSAELALKEGVEYEYELRIYFQTNQSVKWVLVKCRPKLITEALSSSDMYQYNLHGIVMDIDQRKKNETALKELHEKMLLLARQTGMSEVAASILHNIGNILNSAGISLAYLREKRMTDLLLNLKKIIYLLEKGIEKNPTYLSSDEKGRLIPGYLTTVSTALIERDNEFEGEILSLGKHIDHIKSIVLMQTEISGISGVSEKITLNDLVNQALKMAYNEDIPNRIQVTSVDNFEGEVTINKTRVLQILINLLSNAKQAVMMSETQDSKKIHITMQYADNRNFFEIRVADNGIGINKSQLKKIFTMGYTTKKKGHGIGLHMSAISASEMGGKLTLESGGLNQGATFILTLPIHN